VANELRFVILMVAIVILAIILQLLRRGRIPVKFTLLWLIADGILFLLAIFPFVLNIFTGIIGFQTTSNLVIGIFIVILLLVTIALTVIVAGQATKTQLLIQELSMLKQQYKESEIKQERENE
jgi:Uncharacterized conserved protein (DUF2304).